MNVVKWAGLLIGMMLLGGLLGSILVAKALLTVSLALFLLLFIAGPVAGFAQHRTG